MLVDAKGSIYTEAQLLFAEEEILLVAVAVVVVDVIAAVRELICFHTVVILGVVPPVDGAFVADANLRKDAEVLKEDMRSLVPVHRWGGRVGWGKWRGWGSRRSGEGGRAFVRQTCAVMQ